MNAFFLICAIFGGVVLIAQQVLGLGSDGHGHGLDDGPDVPDMGDGTGDPHGSTWFFGVLSFQTVVIGITFFGLVGWTANAFQLEQPLPLVAAAAAGVGAMYGVYFLMRGLYRLNADGTERIERAVGLEATVYVPIPAQRAGAGKVHLTLQNRLVEYQAMTAGDRLPTGAQVVVTAVIGPDKVEVELIPEAART